jgi:hypothetical protein
VAVAAAAAEMPTVMGLASEGRISASMLHALARVATPHNQARLADVCVTASPSQAQRVIGTCESIRDADRTDPDAPAPTWFRSYWDESGRLRISAALDAEDGAIWQRANDAARAAFERAHPEPEAAPEPDAEPDLVRGRADVRPRVSDLEALRQIADLAIDQADATGLTDRGSERFSVVISADLAELTGSPQARGHACRVLDGPELPVDAVRRLCCDGKVQGLLHDARHAMAMGREIRVVNRAMRRALRVRDGGCAVPGCDQTRWVDAHHIVHWTDGGRTDLENLVLLCRTHHRAVHEGGWTISGNSIVGLEFVDPRSRRVGVPDVHDPPGRPTLRLVPSAATPAGAGERLSRDGYDSMIAYLLTA